MNTHFIIFMVGLVLSTAILEAQDESPALKEPPERLVAVIDSTDRANFTAACINVIREAKRKHLTVYATVATANTTTIKEGDHEVEIVYNADLVKEHKTSGGAYHKGHNNLVFTFASAQFASGQKHLGLRILKVIADADPQFWWSSPTHPPITIQKIIAGLEKEDDSLRDFLKYQREDWEYRVKTCGN